MKQFTMILAGAMVLFLSNRSEATDGPALGVVLSDQPSATGGVAITGVVFGSPAAQIGLQAGDQITAVNGQPISDYREILKIVAAGTPGSQIRLDILRGDWHATRSAYLGSHQQVFAGKPVIRGSTVPTAARVPPWRSYTPRSYWPRRSTPPWRTHPREDLWTSLGNSDG
jgi:membrane-associated protease RseP (regulator of RpoE activity)